MRRILPVLILALVCLAAGGAWFVFGRDPAAGTTSAGYRPPPEGKVTLFPAPARQTRIFTIDAATDVSFTRPFILAFQKDHPEVTVRYVDFISLPLFKRAGDLCAQNLPTADLYLTVSTDHLVRLANDGCAMRLPQRVVRGLPQWAQWRNEVVAFSLEPAVFVYNTDLMKPADVPQDHLELIEMLRKDQAYWRGRIGAYDIDASGSGYLYAALDAQQSATYGRLIESFGRSEMKTYCCSNEMAEAVANREITFAYNVQMSYAYAAQRAGRPVGVVLPRDYRAVHTRSVMVPRDAGNPADAIAFTQLLNSPRGQEIASSQLSQLRGETPDGLALIPVPVGPIMLGLGDQARRSGFIAEWRNALSSNQSKDAPAEAASDREGASSP